jgi:hypothetical protein
MSRSKVRTAVQLFGYGGCERDRPGSPSLMQAHAASRLFGPQPHALPEIDPLMSDD